LSRKHDIIVSRNVSRFKLFLSRLC